MTCCNSDKHQQRTILGDSCDAKHHSEATSDALWISSCCYLQGSITGASSGAQADAVKAEARVQDLQGRLKIAEQERAASEQAQKVGVHAVHSCFRAVCSAHILVRNHALL